MIHNNLPWRRAISTRTKLLNWVCSEKNTVYPKKYAHGFVVFCFVVVMQSVIMNSHEVFIHIRQGCFAGTGAIVRLPQCQWSKPDGYGKISQCITTTKHSKAKTVCIFLGIYCIFPWQCYVINDDKIISFSRIGYITMFVFIPLYSFQSFKARTDILPWQPQFAHVIYSSELMRRLIMAFLYCLLLCFRSTVQQTAVAAWNIRSTLTFIP